MSKARLLFSGPVLTASGYGVHARQLLSALVNTGLYDIAVESLKWGETPILADPSLEWIRELSKRSHAQIDVSIQVTIPNEFKRRAPLTIGVTAGIEVDRVSPHWISKCNSEVDLVVVPSEHSRSSFMVEYQSNNGAKLRLEKPIFVIPEGVDTDVFRPAQARSQLLPDNLPPKNFIFTGLGLDKANGSDRKNVTRLIQYFCKTFAGNKSVGLILKTSIVNYSHMDAEVTVRRINDIKTSTGCGEYPRITLIHGRLSEQDMAGLYNDPRVISAISLTHGEGFGLPLIEAAACGLPVMATDWSGHLDFLTRSGRKLFVPIAFELKEIPPECVWEGVMDAGTRWAEPSEADVSSKLQKMVISSETPRAWATELSEHISKGYSLSAVGALFTNLVSSAFAEMRRSAPKSRDEFVAENRRRITSRGPGLIYTMPMSAGDVFLSTAVVKSLREKHPETRIYFATKPEYFHILKGVSVIDEIVEWKEWMLDVELLEDIFDEVYTPNMTVQLAGANWIHRGKGRGLLEEFAAQCNVIASYSDVVLPSKAHISLKRDRWVAVHAGGQKSARRYSHWSQIVKNLRTSGVRVMQVGAVDDMSIGPVDEDARGGDHAALVGKLSSVQALICIDSYPMHVAAALEVPVVAVFGSSYPSSTGPRARIGKLTLIETPDRKGCNRACYKDQCKVDVDSPCIDNVDPRVVYESAMDAVGIQKSEFKKFTPMIAGYTHLLSPLKHGYPYIQSIESMLGFCTEVVVVNGDSSDGDGSIAALRERFKDEIATGRLSLIDRDWDYDEPGMDGIQKAFGRAMVSPNAEFLWQQDADEIVHERDYERIVDVCRKFPSDVDLIHLPVIELWGDDRHARTDRHSWKWRLSRNNLRITHGINRAARVVCDKTGFVYAKPGQSDGCEMIDMVTGEHLSHRGFYTKQLDELRVRDPMEYGRIMNDVYSKLPSVWHYSWADLPRKVRNFRDFWDKQWQALYRTPPQPRFPDVKTEQDVERKAAELLTQGGEHSKSQTFELRLEPPAVMSSFKK